MQNQVISLNKDLMFKKIFSFLEIKEKQKFLVLIVFLIIGLFIEALGLGIIVPMISFFSMTIL